MPVPPGPDSVSRRVVPSRSSASRSSRSRPTNVVSWVGRLFGRASSERIGGKSAGRPSMTTWAIRSGARRSLRRCWPRSRSETPSGSSPSTSARVVSLSSTWPPWATAAMRAVRLMATPMTSLPVDSISPVCRPIRTRIGAACGQGSAASARCASAAADRASIARRKMTKNESPSVPCSCPPYARFAARTMARWRSRRSRYGPVPSSSSMRVEPSMSLNRQVTVPVGGPGVGGMALVAPGGSSGGGLRTGRAAGRRVRAGSPARRAAAP